MSAPTRAPSAEAWATAFTDASNTDPYGQKPPEGKDWVKTGPHVMVVGGAPLDGPRFITWNFVSSRRERILQAGADWQAQRMGQVPGETEFIPLPGPPFQVASPAPDTGTTPV